MRNFAFYRRAARHQRELFSWRAGGKGEGGGSSRGSSSSSHADYFCGAPTVESEREGLRGAESRGY